MTQEELIDRVAAEMARVTEVRALFLSGSFGRGTADAWSDVDLVAIAAGGDLLAVADTWRGLLERIAHVVYWNQLGSTRVLLNAVTEDWLRCDLLITPPDRLEPFVRDRLRVLFDHDHIAERLPPTTATSGPDSAKVAATINELIRVLGLLPVVVERKEYLTSVTGVGLQRDHLTNLMVEEAASPDRGGALHLSRLLPPEDMRILMDLPYPRPERREVIDAHLAIARVFFPRARDLSQRLGLAWPEEFERATLDHLRRIYGDTIRW